MVVAWAAIACLMAGCDPAAVPRDPNQISMQLTVGEHGDGNVRLGSVVNRPNSNWSRSDRSSRPRRSLMPR